jgi:nucleoside-diphosphate kinase
MVESTFVMIKPDGVQRGLCGEIIRRFEVRGLRLAGLKLRIPTKELAAEHYAQLVTPSLSRAASPRGRGLFCLETK